MLTARKTLLTWPSSTIRRRKAQNITKVTRRYWLLWRYIRQNSSRQNNPITHKACGCVDWLLWCFWFDLVHVTLHNEKLEHVYRQENEYKSWLHCVLWELSLATLLDRLINYTQVKNWLLNSGGTIFSYTVFRGLTLQSSNVPAPERYLHFQARLRIC